MVLLEEQQENYEAFLLHFVQQKYLLFIVDSGSHHLSSQWSILEDCTITHD